MEKVIFFLPPATPGDVGRLGRTTPMRCEPNHLIDQIKAPQTQPYLRHGRTVSPLSSPDNHIVLLIADLLEPVGANLAEICKRHGERLWQLFFNFNRQSILKKFFDGTSPAGADSDRTFPRQQVHEHQWSDPLFAWQAWQKQKTMTSNARFNP